MTTVGFIGSGQIGSAFARSPSRPGNRWLLSNSTRSRNARGKVVELGPRASAATSGEAAAVGDIVVVTVPVKAFPDLPGPPATGGKDGHRHAQLRP